MSYRKIYRKIAKKYGISVKEVKREMQNAIDCAYENPSQNDFTKAKQRQVSQNGNIAIPDAFISFGAENIKKE